MRSPPPFSRNSDAAYGRACADSIASHSDPMKPPDIDYNAKGNTRDRIFPRERNSNLSAHTRNFRSFIYYSCETNGIEIYFDAEKDISFGEICNEAMER